MQEKIATEGVIRTACLKDFPRMLALNSQSVHFLSPLNSQRLAHLHNQAAYRKIIEVDGQVQAFLLAFRQGANYDSPNYIWFSQRYHSFCYIDRVVVQQDYRRQGFAAALYDDLLRSVCEGEKAPITCEIDIMPANPGSLAFHDGYGFIEVGRQWLYDGKKQVSLRERRCP